MADVAGEIKNLEGLTQTLIQTVKSVDQSLERLRSIEQLMERVAASNDEISRNMKQMTDMYNQAITNNANASSNNSNTRQNLA